MASKAITDRIQSLTDRELQEQFVKELILQNERLKDISFYTATLLVITIGAIIVSGFVVFAA